MEAFDHGIKVSVLGPGFALTFVTLYLMETLLDSVLKPGN